ncbi:MAG: cytochrome C [Pseudoruegeria sp.]
MNILTLALCAIPVMATSVIAGDAALGEKDFKRCKACHSITGADGTVFQKGGKTGPNLGGIIGRDVGSYEGFSYGKGLLAAGDAGLIWDEASVAAFITDPKAWIAEVTGDSSAKTKMTYKHKKGAENMAAYLSSVGQ